MSDPGDQQRSQQDRGYYGAGWSQPAPPAGGQYGAPAGPGGQHGAPAGLGSQYGAPTGPGGQYGAPTGPGGQYGAPAGPGGQYGAPTGPGGQYGGPYAPPRPQRRPADPRRAFAPGASVTNTAGALIAVVSLVLVEFVSGLAGLLGTSLLVHPFASYGDGTSLVSSFVSGVFAAPFPFYVGAFAVLAFLAPIARRSPLPTVLLRAVLAGAAGTLALALVGVVTGSFGAVRYGGGHLVIDVLTAPIQRGVPFTVMLLATSTAAWLWLGRPRGGRRGLGAPGTPGTVRPADAVPPATVQPSSGPQQPYGQQPGAQPPSAPWGGPAPR